MFALAVLHPCQTSARKHFLLTPVPAPANLLATCPGRARHSHWLTLMNNAVTIDTGWQAQLDLQFGVRAAKTRLLAKRQYGPLTLQRPFYPEGETCHAYLLHPPGGVVGGDSLRVNIDAQQDAHCLLTTPGATKLYRSSAHLLSHVNQRVSVAAGATVEWLPQQNIFFPGAHAALSTAIDIAPGGRYLGWEINCLGRPANTEAFHGGSVRSNTRVTIDGVLRLAEQFQVSGTQALGAATGLRGLPLQGCFIAAPCQAAQRDALEQILQSTPYPHPIGITLVDDILIARALGEQTEPLQRIFTQLWQALRPLWLQKAACLPRIWST
jgi:urease accessory protein